jgi:hypothetical protein
MLALRGWQKPSGATLLPAERVAPFRGLKTQTPKSGPPVTNLLHLGRKALVRRRLKHSSIEVDCDAHFSQADSFAVVPEPTAEPSAWETERGRCFHDHQCNQRLSQGLTADVQYVVTPMARGVPTPLGLKGRQALAHSPELRGDSLKRGFPGPPRSRPLFRPAPFDRGAPTRSARLARVRRVIQRPESRRESNGSQSRCRPASIRP